MFSRLLGQKATSILSFHTHTHACARTCTHVHTHVHVHLVSVSVDIRLSYSRTKPCHPDWTSSVSYIVPYLSVKRESGRVKGKRGNGRPDLLNFGCSRNIFSFFFSFSSDPSTCHPIYENFKPLVKEFMLTISSSLHQVLYGLHLE